MKRVYVRARGNHTHTHSDLWVKLTDGSFLHRLSEEELAEYVSNGIFDIFYIEDPNGEIVAEPWEDLELFGKPSAPPAMRFRRARLELVPAD